MLEDLIKCLQSKTKEEIYNWDCLDDCIKDNCNLVNTSLRKFVVTNNKSYYNNGYKEKFFKKYRYNNSDYIYYPLSYVLNVEGGVVTLLTYLDKDGNHYYILYLQNKPKNDLFAINTKMEFQNELKELLITIKDKRDNVDNLIKKILGNE